VDVISTDRKEVQSHFKLGFVEVIWLKRSRAVKDLLSHMLECDPMRR
jgi:hypothetical protein